MKTLTIKNLPEKLHAQLKKSAALNRRSMSSEAIFCLEKVLVGDRVDPAEFLQRARALRARMPQMFITDEDLRAAKNEGRP